MPTHTPREHALLSASSSQRWLTCSPSVRIEEGLPDTAGEAAAEGTLAHEIAELKARKLFEGIPQRTFTSKMNKLIKDPLYKPEMQTHTDAYAEYLSECAMKYDNAPTVFIETRIEYSEWAQEGFGRVDCIMANGGLITVVDFKYGMGVRVDAENNTQLMLYALGALSAFRMIYGIQRVKLAIVQPRIDHICEWEITVDALLHWAETVVKPHAVLAFAGEGPFRPDAEAQCRFCKARGQCRALANQQMEGLHKADPATLSDAELGELLTRAKPFIKWLGTVEDYALGRALSGNAIAGWKVVESTGRYAFTDMGAAFAALMEAGFDESQLYERKPITVAVAKKLAGKAKFMQTCDCYVTQKPGNPALVKETDPRVPYNPAAADFEITTQETTAE